MASAPAVKSELSVVKPRFPQLPPVPNPRQEPTEATESYHPSAESAATAAVPVPGARVIRVHPCASVVKKRGAIQGFIMTQPVFEQKTGKAGKGIGPTSFVALRVHSWFNLRGAIARRFMASNPSV